MICGEYVEIMLNFAQYSIHILSNQQLVTSTVIDDHASRQPLATSTEPLGAEKFGQTLKKSSSRGRKTREKLPHPVTIFVTLFTFIERLNNLELGRKFELENLDLSQWRSS